MRFVAFDVETARVLPADVQNLLDYMPLGVACAALAFGDRGGSEATEVWHGVPGMTREGCRALVRRLQELVAQGYHLVTWNGCSFDLRVLGVESGMVQECGELALGHVDLMAYVTFREGHFLGMEKVLQGAGLGGKVRSVRLPDGREVDPSGANAPVLWAQGEDERAAVIAYLREDVAQLLRLVEHVRRRGELVWRSRRGKLVRLPVEEMGAVHTYFQLPVPDTSWMDLPPSRRGFVEWIPGCTLA